jgi:uncharacterized coiled-coil DUF342 family protein
MGSGDITKDQTGDQLARILAEISGLRSEVTELRGEVRALDEKVDSRLKETRPIWESALAQLKELRDEMDKGFRDIGYKMDVLAKDVLQVRADQRDLRADQREIEDRLRRL